VEAIEAHASISQLSVTSVFHRLWDQDHSSDPICQGQPRCPPCCRIERTDHTIDRALLPNAQGLALATQMALANMGTDQ
jgi:hypothetical protein